MIRMLGRLTMAVALVAAAPAFAGGPVSALKAGYGEHARLGAFAGARVRLALGRGRPEPMRAALTLTGVRTLPDRAGRVRTLYGEGIAFGYDGGRSPGWSLAGRSIGPEPSARRNMSTLGTVAVVAGAVLVAGGIYTVLLFREAERNSD